MKTGGEKNSLLGGSNSDFLCSLRRFVAFSTLDFFFVLVIVAFSLPHVEQKERKCKERLKNADLDFGFCSLVLNFSQLNVSLEVGCGLVGKRKAKFKLISLPSALCVFYERNTMTFSSLAIIFKHFFPF